MYCKYWIISIGMLFLVACNEPLPQHVIEEAPEARLIVTEKIMSPEERALENKLANRTLLQKVVDESEQLERVEYPFECNNHTGGILTLIQDKNQLKGIRFALSTTNSSEFMSLYYQREELAFIVYEKGAWQGDTERDQQTIFYLDKGEVLRCMRKTAEGTTESIERLIQAADFQIISTDEQLLQKIQHLEIRFKTAPTALKQHFCKG